MQQSYRNALTRIIGQISQIKETIYGGLKNYLINFSEDQDIKIKIVRLINHTDNLLLEGASYEKLTHALLQTDQFLKGRIEPAAYQKLIKSFNAERSPGLKALGIIMMALAAVVVASGLVIAPAITMALGVSAIGVGLFAAGAVVLKKGNDEGTELTEEMSAISEYRKGAIQ